ncbi:MAG: hypothetical protein AB8H86_29730 [Polyangiales bacterium]
MTRPFALLLVWSLVSPASVEADGDSAALESQHILAFRLELRDTQQHRDTAALLLPATYPGEWVALELRSLRGSREVIVKIEDDWEATLDALYDPAAELPASPDFDGAQPLERFVLGSVPGEITEPVGACHLMVRFMGFGRCETRRPFSHPHDPFSFERVWYRDDEGRVASKVGGYGRGAIFYDPLVDIQDFLPAQGSEHASRVGTVVPTESGDGFEYRAHASLSSGAVKLLERGVLELSVSAESGECALRRSGSPDDVFRAERDGDRLTFRRSYVGEHSYMRQDYLCVGFHGTSDRFFRFRADVEVWRERNVVAGSGEGDEFIQTHAPMWSLGGPYVHAPHYDEQIEEVIVESRWWLIPLFALLGLLLGNLLLSKLASGRTYSKRRAIVLLVLAQAAALGVLVALHASERLWAGQTFVVLGAMLSVSVVAGSWLGHRRARFQG